MNVASKETKKDVIFEIKNLTKTYGNFKANDNINFKIYRNENIAIVGANGGGKTTLVEQIAGVKVPTKGSISSVFGKKVTEIAEHMGVQFQDSKYPDGMTVSDMITFYLDIYNERFQKSSRAKIAKRRTERIEYRKNIPAKIKELRQKQSTTNKKYNEKITELQRKLKVTKSEEADTIKKELSTALKNKKDFGKVTKTKIKIIKAPLDSAKARRKTNKEIRIKRRDLQRKIIADFLQKRRIKIKKLFNEKDYQKRVVIKSEIHDLKREFKYKKKHNPRTTRQKRVAQYVKLFSLEGLEKRQIKKLSGGQQQRLNVLLALIHKPEFMILDEISTGLDVQSRGDIKSFVKKILTENDVTLLLVSHNMDEIEELADRVLYMLKGRIVEDHKVKDLIQKYGSLTKWVNKMFKKHTEEQH